MFSEDHNRKISHQVDYRLSQIPEEYYSAWKDKSVDELSLLSERIVESLSRPSILDDDREHMKKLLSWITTLIESNTHDSQSRDVFTRS